MNCSPVGHAGESLYKDGWMTCHFTSFGTVFHSLSGQCYGDKERLRAVEPQLWLERFLPQVGSNLGPLGQ